MSSVRIKLASTDADSRAEGIHLVDPSERELEMAREDAEVKGFSTISIERDRQPGEPLAPTTRILPVFTLR